MGKLHICLQLFTITLFLTAITHVGGSNGVDTGPTKHWLHFLNNTNPV